MCRLSVGMGMDDGTGDAGAVSPPRWMDRCWPPPSAASLPGSPAARPAIHRPSAACGPRVLELLGLVQRRPPYTRAAGRPASWAVVVFCNARQNASTGALRPARCAGCFCRPAAVSVPPPAHVVLLLGCIGVPCVYSALARPPPPRQHTDTPTRLPARERALSIVGSASSHPGAAFMSRRIPRPCPPTPPLHTLALPAGLPRPGRIARCAGTRGHGAWDAARAHGADAGRCQPSGSWGFNSTVLGRSPP